jgi:hypothetical protein
MIPGHFGASRSFSRSLGRAIVALARGCDSDPLEPTARFGAGGDLRLERLEMGALLPYREQLGRGATGPEGVIPDQRYGQWAMELPRFDGRVGA